MAHLIAVNRDRLTVISLLVLIAGCSLSNKTALNQDVFLQVDFQDFFDNDKVGLKFNNCTLFVNEWVTTTPAVGFTNLRVKLVKHSLTEYKVIYGDKILKCKNDNSKVKLVVYLNDQEQEFAIDPGKGKFIGFSKKNNKELYISQSVSPFIYE